MSLTDGARRDMGCRGRELAATRYAWDAIAARMRRVYAWMIGQQEPPNFVE
jgi:hypothetical protein